MNMSLLLIPTEIAINMTVNVDNLHSLVFQYFIIEILKMTKDLTVGYGLNCSNQAER